MDLKDLYRDVILDHNKQPRNFGRLDPCDTSADGNNPLCGDRLTLTLRLEGDRLTDIRFEGKGCAISTASASLMTEAVKGKDQAAITRLRELVHQTLTAHGEATLPPAELGKLAALAGVRDYPARRGHQVARLATNAQLLRPRNSDRHRRIGTGLRM
ncbi:MAG: SUF system NifU family Fe-S cluster assembly protein [Gammaproteobacteria bacterium]|nr:SUF system NifU family Fe-S cluster assembly protein [Gammaproteobacteria bacterium]